MSPRTAPLSLLEHAHARTADEVLSALDSCPAGLSADEAARRLAEVGPNRLPEPPRDGLLKRFFKHFNDVLIYVLLGAAAITATPRPLDRHRRHPRRGGHQRHHRLHPGGQGRGGARRHPQDAVAACRCPARRPMERRGRRRPGAGRHRAPALGRPRAGRPAPDRGHQPAHRGVRAHRRVRARRQDHRGGRRRCRRGRPPRHGLLRHPGRRRARHRRGRRHRPRHRARPHQPPDRRGADPADPAHPADGAVQQDPVDRHRRPGRAHAGRRPRGARAAAGRGLPGRDRLRGRGHPRGPARHPHHHARARRAAHGAAQRDHPQADRGRGARLGHRDLLGQDRHADEERDDRAPRRSPAAASTRSAAPATAPRARSPSRARSPAWPATATCKR